MRRRRRRRSSGVETLPVKIKKIKLLVTSTVASLEAVFLQYSLPVMFLLRTFSMLKVEVFPYCSIWWMREEEKSATAEKKNGKRRGIELFVSSSYQTLCSHSLEHTGARVRASEGDEREQRKSAGEREARRE